MRCFALVIATTAALIACGQPASTAAPSEAAAQGSAAAATAAIESQAEYLARCTRDMIAANPQSRAWAPDQCQQQWETVAAAGPMAEAILAAAPVSGAVDPATLRGRLTMVRWDARPEGTLVASGRLGGALSVQVERAPSLNFYWSETGALIPYDVVEALRGRGAEVTMIGCSPLGGGENNQAYRVVANGRAPFALSVYGRPAPTANAGAFYNVGLNLTGQVPTLAQLSRDGSEWAPACPY